MKCNNCNAELLEGSSFCPYCGTKCDEGSNSVVKEVEVLNNEPKEEVQTEPGCWATFAKISNILGTVTMCTFWIPIFGFLAIIPGVPGIVFGGLGKNSKKDDVKERAASGFRKSLIGTILATALYFLVIFIIAIASEM